MKTKTLFLMIAMAVTMAATAQDFDDIYSNTVETRQVAQQDANDDKSRENSIRALNDSIAHQRAKYALQRGYWVLLADRIILGRTGNTIFDIQSNANFVYQQGKEGMVQFALNGVSSGLNGLGGITMKGGVSGAELTTDKNGDLHYSFHIASTEINAQVFITVYKDMAHAQAIVDSTFDSGQMTIYGRLVPYDLSRH